MLSNDGEMTLFLFSFILESTGSALKKERKEKEKDDYVSRRIALMDIPIYTVHFRKPFRALFALKWRWGRVRSAPK